MATYEPSIADVIKSALRDAQDLVRGEIALAKAEAREEFSRISIGAGLLAAAAVAAVLGLVFLMGTIAWAISEGLAWPVWAGFGIVTLLTFILAGILASVGKRRLSAARHMPRTVDTLKENMEWMRARTP
jgi:uncharacterized membrane protein YqjE